MAERKTLAELINLSGKSAIVTGGAVGIGNAIATRLTEAGSRVLLADKDSEAVAVAASTMPGAVPFVVDISDESQVKAMVDTAEREFGGVDILINNAGIYPFVPVLSGTEEDFKKILQVNLVGAFLAAKHVAAQMISQGKGGTIINITSIDALHPSAVGLAFYDASKHGLWGFTKNLARELAPHSIRVNAIAPGGIRTPGTGLDGVATNPNIEQTVNEFTKRIPMGRMGDADEIGTVAVFLASDMASYITGSQIVADGGALLV